MTEVRLGDVIARSQPAVCIHGGLCRQCETCDLADRLEACERRLVEAQALVAAQAEDWGLWCVAATAPEAYLQQALRRVHRAIEGEEEER